MQLAETLPDLQAYVDEQRLVAYLDYGSILWEGQDYGYGAAGFSRATLRADQELGVTEGRILKEKPFCQRQ